MTLAGAGLNSGKIYIGVAGQDPQSFPQAVFWDSAGTVPASQPLNVLGGYIMYLGSPAQVFTAPTYSMRVRDKSGVQIFYSSNLPNLAAALKDLSNVDFSQTPTLIQLGTPTNAGDGTRQFQVFQSQPNFFPNGSLGAVYGQRLSTYVGGAANDAAATVVGAVRGYNQINSSVTYSVEVGGLFVADNYSYVSQGVGIYGQAISQHGGRSWGGVLEAQEYPETFTATAGQTSFLVPNGFNTIGAVTKNGTLLTPTSQYTVSSPTVTLVTGASFGDVIKIYRSNPAYAQIGAEIDCFAGPGTDTANAISGNRIGLAVFGYRRDKTVNVQTHVGTVLAIIADPGDASYLVADRGIQLQGQYGIGLDFSASNASYSSYFLKINSAGAGITAAGNLALGNVGTYDLAGYASIMLGNTTNGGLIRVGDGTHVARMQGGTASGAVFGSETAIDTILWRNSLELVRLTPNTGAKGVGVSLAFAPASTSYASDVAAAIGGVPIGGIYRNGSALQIRVS